MTPEEKPVQAPTNTRVIEFQQKHDNTNVEKFQCPDIEPEFSIDNPELPLIPDDIYTLGYEGYETYYYFGTPKVKMDFVVIDGEHQGTKLNRFYNVRKLIGPTGKNGRFKPGGGGSDLVRDWTKLFGKPKRGDRLSLRKFKTVLIKARVSTVTQDSKKNPLPFESRYSCISEFISTERVEG